MELDMEMDEGQPQGCPLFLGWERRFWREYAAGLSLEADRQLGGLNYIVVPGLAILHEIGDGDAV